ncbi:ras-like small GTPase, putative [Trypanosoma equiperdum]|uniref:Small GTPase, putative n=2 Tax=Trypanozoon TaxID=39700 RepID=Q38A82_TRYB2|nr:small GTPase, putative [Trypanosoma brucei brucei TREU927]EAN78288.1 small GTPase, putative [Trypanosoma brucei brucei TREU927]SCU71301.1 ras-like small GTPase, putative [Trypanosoma equiperdum]
MTSSFLAHPKVLLMGLRKSGKTSIQKVVFEGMQPHHCVDLTTTVQPEKSTVCSYDFVNFEVWDFPGQTDPFDLNNTVHYDVGVLLENCGAIVFVMDCGELIDDSHARLVETVCAAYDRDPELSVEVFIHKVDKLSEDHQADLLTSLQRRVEAEARQRLNATAQLRLNFNLTSIYDHSVFQAFSSVVQKLMKLQIPYITELLQILNSNSNLDLSYLFLSRSKIFLSVDERNRVKTRTYEICSDAIEVMMGMNRIYSKGKEQGEGDEEEVSSGARGTEAEVYAGANIVIKLSSDDCIYVKELPNSLTLVSMVKNESFRNRILIDHNISAFYNAAYSIFRRN